MVGVDLTVVGLWVECGAVVVTVVVGEMVGSAAVSVLDAGPAATEALGVVC